MGGDPGWAQVGRRRQSRDNLLPNMAGQSVSALIPLGDLTRALFASAATVVPVGQVAATATVEELGYTTLMLLAAAPEAGRQASRLSARSPGAGQRGVMP